MFSCQTNYYSYNIHITYIIDATEDELSRWLETFNKSLPTAVKRKKNLSPFIYFKSSVDNSPHVGELHELFAASKTALESSQSMFVVYTDHPRIIYYS